MMNKKALPLSVSVNRGFTLIEIVVAIAVFSLSIIVLLNSAGQSAKSLSSVKAKMVGLNIAEQVLNRILLIEDFPDVDRKEEILTFSGNEWLVEIEISDPFVQTDDARRIDVKVQPYGEDVNIEKKTTLLSGFRVNIF